MRMLLCLLPLVLAAAPPPDASPSCPAATLSESAHDQKPLMAHPLGQEPGARQEIAVQQTDADHCVHPIVVRDNVGGKAPPETPAARP